MLQFGHMERGHLGTLRMELIPISIVHNCLLCADEHTNVKLTDVEADMR